MPLPFIQKPQSVACAVYRHSSTTIYIYFNKNKTKPMKKNATVENPGYNSTTKARCVYIFAINIYCQTFYVAHSSLLVACNITLHIAYFLTKVQHTFTSKMIVFLYRRKKLPRHYSVVHNTFWNSHCC